mmetsp:Transcript_31908/g.36278  ORF Transcript_31908/g.36278 Transcript_31908/m.36278 type:complete len:307 (-) Transcript_31908:171-1091(-)
MKPFSLFWACLLLTFCLLLSLGNQRSPLETNSGLELLTDAEEVARRTQCQEYKFYDLKTYLSSTGYNPYWYPGGGSLLKVAANHLGEPTVLGTDHLVYHFNGTWTQLSGVAATDIGAGATRGLWVVGGGTSGVGNGIYNWSSNAWVLCGGDTNRAVAVTPDGNVVVIKDNYQTWAWRGHWAYLGLNSELGIGAKGEMYTIGTDFDSNGNASIYQYFGDEKMPVAGRGKTIEVDNVGMPLILDASGILYRKTQSGWETRNYSKRLRDIAVSPGGNLWVIDNVNGLLYHHTESVNDSKTGITNIYSCY